jgi:hypothetical protein
MTNKELKFELVLDNYPTTAISSNSKRAKYYSSTPGRGRIHKLPKKMEKEGYSIDIEGFYLNKMMQRVVSNTKTVGKPGTIPINAQVFYVGKPFQRMIIKNFVEEYLNPFVSKMPVINYPLYMESEVHAIYQHRLPDMNNIGYVWDKILTDVMVKQGKIVDDSPLYLTKPGSAPLYYPVETEEERKIVFRFYKDLRPEIATARQLYLNI